MADALISKPFNEGAPLDPNALNDLRSDLLNTYKKANTLYNENQNGQTQSYKYLFNCGEIRIDVTKVSVPFSVPLELGSGFESTPSPVITTSVRMTSAPKEGQQTNVYVTSQGGANYQLHVISNKLITAFVQWTAVQKIPTSN